MIPRHQIAIFAVLLAASLAMGGVLWHLRDRAHKRLLEGNNTTPTQAPEVTPPEAATLDVASDDDSSITPRELALPLPQSPGARARAVLGKLLELYAAPGSRHPVPGGAGSVSHVFLLPAASTPASASAGPDPAIGQASKMGAPGPSHLGTGETTTVSSTSGPAASPANAAASGDEVAVVDLTGAFVAGHPSGIETETLTVLSICATLHANQPRITKVRFLVDGKPRSTLAGHVDLTRTYLAGEAAPAGGGGQP